MKSSTFRVSLCFLALVSVAGCGKLGSHSPVIDVLGSYFPAWIVCIVTGLTLTLIARLLFIGLKWDKGMRPAVIVYPCLMIIFTMVVWLAFYRN